MFEVRDATEQPVLFIEIGQVIEVFNKLMVSEFASQTAPSSFKPAWHNRSPNTCAQAYRMLLSVSSIRNPQ
ncbi:hypothetical protein FIV00_18640 [Labrenzia sp. THAF82]|nr:hypothetical protein FIV00_18640 [Labrenzia sp. THAF82]